MTRGPLAGVLLRVAAPIAAANFVAAAYGLINLFFVGRLGAHAIASVAGATPLYDVLINLGSGLSVAGGVIVAQYAGAGRRDALDHVVAQTLLAVVALAATFALAGMLLAPSVLRLVGAEPAVRSTSAAYLAVLYWGMVPQFAFFAIRAMMQSVGEVRYATAISLMTIALNAALDPLLIFGVGHWPGLGVRGAAFATVSVQSWACAMMLLRLLSGRSLLRLRWREMRPDPVQLRQTLSLGWPASFEQGVRTFSSVLLMSTAAHFGTFAPATYALGVRVMQFFFSAIQGLSIATSVVTAQNLGAGLRARVDEGAWTAGWLAFGLFEAVGLVLAWPVAGVMQVLAPHDPGLAAAATGFSRVYLPFLGVLALPQVLNGVFRGSGSTRQAMVLSMAMQWLFQMPSAWILALATPLGVAGVWWSYPIGNIGASLMCLAWLRWGPWRRAALVDPRLAAEEARLEAETAIPEA